MPIFKRVHFCSDCQGKELNQSEWKNHVEKHQKTLKEIFSKTLNNKKD